MLTNFIFIPPSELCKFLTNFCFNDLNPTAANYNCMASSKRSARVDSCESPHTVESREKTLSQEAEIGDMLKIKSYRFAPLMQIQR